MSVPALPASTVIVLRDADGGGLEVYMVQRPAQSSFLAGAHVFPGGRVEPDDHDEAWRTLPGRLRRDHRPHAIAAVRELFEEAGLLLAYDAGTDRPVDLSARDQAALASSRADLIRGSRRFSRACADEGWWPAIDLLGPYSRWITPHVERRRFDTMFYVTRAPAGQVASVDGQEAVAGRWVRPHVAIGEQVDGRIVLAPPTLQTLMELSDAAGADAVLAAAAARTPRTYAPRVLVEAGTRFVLLPGDELYPAPEDEALAGPTRYRLDGKIWRAER
jgi:8-oxo-dGTP pyrophosphatase MutT (NUDIX family)